MESCLWLFQLVGWFKGWCLFVWMIFFLLYCVYFQRWSIFTKRVLMVGFFLSFYSTNFSLHSFLALWFFFLKGMAYWLECKNRLSSSNEKNDCMHTHIYTLWRENKRIRTPRIWLVTIVIIYLTDGKQQLMCVCIRIFKYVYWANWEVANWAPKKKTVHSNIYTIPLMYDSYFELCKEPNRISEPSNTTKKRESENQMRKKNPLWIEII